MSHVRNFSPVHPATKMWCNVITQDVIGEMARLDEEMARAEELRTHCVARMSAIVEQRRALMQQLNVPIPVTC